MHMAHCHNTVMPGTNLQSKYSILAIPYNVIFDTTLPLGLSLGNFATHVAS
jgi:hypothetical protein